MEKKFLNRNLHTHFVWFFKTWIFTFENWCFQTFEFPSPRLQCIYWNFFLHQRNVQKHFQFDEAEYCEEKCTICIKKKLNVVIKIFSPFLFNIYFGIDWFSQNCKQVDVKFEESKQLSMFVTVIKLKGISVQKIFNLDFGIGNVRTLFYHQLTCLQADIDTKNHPPNNYSWTSFFLKRKIF